jgi:hypothetical protein
MSKTTYHLIHANVAEMLAPLDHPVMSGFVDRIDEIDALAHATPGFVAQPTPPDEGSVFTDNTLLNLSIWETVESLYNFTYQGKHAQVYEQRAEWFAQHNRPNYVLYWAPSGHLPTEREVKKRLDHLIRHGPTPYAFTFQSRLTVEESLAFEVE